MFRANRPPVPQPPTNRPPVFRPATNPPATNPPPTAEQIRRRQLNFIRTESELYRILVNNETITSPFVLQLLSFRSVSEQVSKYSLVLSDCFFYYENFIVDSEAFDRHKFDCFCLIKVTSYRKREIDGRVAIHLLEIERVVHGERIGQEVGLLIEIPIIEVSMDSQFEEDAQVDNMNVDKLPVEIDRSPIQLDSSQSNGRTEDNESSEICEFCSGSHRGSACPYLIDISSMSQRSYVERSSDSEVDSDHSQLCSECRRHRRSSLSSLSSSLGTITISQASSLNTIGIGSTQSGGESGANQVDAAESNDEDSGEDDGEDDMAAQFDDSIDEWLSID